MDDDFLRDAFARDDDTQPDADFADALEDRLRAAASAPTAVVEMADEEEPAVVTRRRRGWRALVALGTAAAVVAALVVIRSGSHSSTKLTLADIANATVGTARVETTITSPSASLSVHVGLGAGPSTTSPPSPPSPPTTTSTMSGEIDFADHASRLVSHERVADGSFFQLSGGELSQPKTRDIESVSLFVDGQQYLSIDTFLAIFGGHVPPALKGKKWIRFDVSALQKSSTATSSTAPATTAAEGSEARTALGSSVTVKQGGTNGGGSLVGTNGFFSPGFGGLGDPAGILDELRKQGATLVAIGPGSVRGTAVQRYRVIVSKPPMSKAHIEVDVDAEGRLRRSILDYDLADMLTDAPKGSQPPHASFRIQTDLFDFGVPVHITAPDPSEVVSMEDLNKALQDSNPLSDILGPHGPKHLTSPWRAIATSTAAPAWSLFRGTATGWTCYAFESAGADMQSVVGFPLPATVDGKNATCFAAGATPTELVGSVGGSRAVLVGVAPANATVTVTLARGGTRAVAVRDGVFAWTARTGESPTKLTITTGSGTVTCQGVTLPVPKGMPQLWSCGGAGGVFPSLPAPTPTTAVSP